MVTAATLILALLFSLGALAFVVWPLVKPGPPPVLVEEDALAELINRKDNALKSIRDLEFDYQVGKISQEDYERYDQSTRRQAMNLLRQMEELAPQAGSLDAQLEKMIANHRKTGDTPSAARAQPSNGAKSQAKKQRFCTECGEALTAQEKFCGSCGAPVAVPTTISSS